MKCNRTVEPLQGLLLATERSDNDARVVTDMGICRIEGMCALMIRQSLFRLSEIDEDASAPVKRLDVGLEFSTAVEMEVRLRQAPHSVEHHSTLTGDIAVMGIKPERVLKAMQGFAGKLEFGAKAAASLP